MKPTEHVILKWMEWTEEQYNLFLWNRGIEYLEMFYSNEKDVVSYLCGSKMYWNWWLNHWQKRDEGIVEQVDIDDLALHLRREYYNKIHDVKMLTCEIAPNRVVLGNLFIHLKEIA